jgi:hypothetical protein
MQSLLRSSRVKLKLLQRDCAGRGSVSFDGQAHLPAEDLRDKKQGTDWALPVEHQTNQEHRSAPLSVHHLE